MAKKIIGSDGNTYVQKKPFYKKWWFIAIVAIVIIGGFSGMNGNKSAPSSDTAKATNSNNKQEKKATEAKKEFHVGQLVKVGDMEYTVNSKSTSQNVGGDFGKNASGVYLILNVTVKNTGKKAITVDANFFNLLKGETEYSSDSSAGIYANTDAKFFLTEVNPGNSITGNVVFDVSQEVIDAPELQLQVQTGAWGTEKEVISINK